MREAGRGALNGAVGGSVRRIACWARAGVERRTSSRAAVGAYLGRAALVALAVLAPQLARAQAPFPLPTLDDWAQLPEGRTWGAVTGVYPDPDGEHIWVLDRCGANTCIDSPLHPVFKFDLDGNLVANFGAGVVAWPHGFFVDGEGNLWVTDGGTDARSVAAAEVGLGHQVVKLSPEGDVLLRLGTPGVPGPGTNTFHGPSAVVVAPDGMIFVADGHDEGGNNRIVAFEPNGRFLRSWGYSGPGPAAGELSDPHALALDSQGRLFVADRRNARIQIFAQDGTFVDAWSQFGPVSDLYIDADDVLYATDTQTAALPEWLQERRGSGWVRGIRIGDARTGEVTGFLQSEAEFVAVDSEGDIYGAEVPGQRLVKYLRSGARGR